MRIKDRPGEPRGSGTGDLRGCVDRSRFKDKIKKCQVKLEKFQAKVFKFADTGDAPQVKLCIKQLSLPLMFSWNLEGRQQLGAIT